MWYFKHKSLSTGVTIWKACACYLCACIQTHAPDDLSKCVRGGLLEFILCLCLCLYFYMYLYLYLYLYLMSPPLTLFLCHCLKMWFNFIALLISLFSKCSVLITANKVGHNPPIPCDASRNWYLPPSFCMFDILCACIQTHARDDLSERVWLGFVWYICFIIVAYFYLQMELLTVLSLHVIPQVADTILLFCAC